MFDALAELDSPDLSQLTNPGRVAKAKKLITQVMTGVAPEELAAEIRRRVQNYRQMWPKATVTSTAIANHWGRLAGGEPGQQDHWTKLEMAKAGSPVEYQRWLLSQGGAR